MNRSVNKRFNMIFVLGLIFVLLFFALVSCKEEAKLGTEDKPIRIMFIPSTDINKVLLNSNDFSNFLSKYLNMPVRSYIATSYSAAVEALGSGNMEIVLMPPTGYVIAADKYGVEPVSTIVRYAKAYYRGMILYNKQAAFAMNREIKSLEDLKGTNFLFTDINSTSGYRYPKLLFQSKGIEPELFFKKVKFSGGHQQSVNQVYQASDPVRDFIACATFDDARQSIANMYPDTFEKVVALSYTGKIPNDLVCIRPNIDEEIDASLRQNLPFKELLQQTFEDMINDPLGKSILKDIFAIENFVPAEDEWYNPVRNVYYATK